jgi:hypothetical protein
MKSFAGFSTRELSALYGALDRIDELFRELSDQRRLYGRGSTSRI